VDLLLISESVPEKAQEEKHYVPHFKAVMTILYPVIRKPITRVSCSPRMPSRWPEWYIIGMDGLQSICKLHSSRRQSTDEERKRTFVYFSTFFSSKHPIRKHHICVFRLLPAPHHVFDPTAWITQCLKVKSRNSVDSSWLKDNEDQTSRLLANKIN